MNKGLTVTLVGSQYSCFNLPKISKPRFLQESNMSWSGTELWGLVPSGGTAMAWNLSDQSSSSRTSDGNTYSIGSPGAMSLDGYSPGYYGSSSYTTDYANANFSVATSDKPTTTAQYPYSRYHETVRVTPKSLGWTPDTQMIQLYDFVVIKGEEPYLDLLSGCNITSQTPQRVYLDRER